MQFTWSSSTLEYNLLSPIHLSLFNYFLLYLHLMYTLAYIVHYFHIFQTKNSSSYTRQLRLNMSLRNSAFSSLHSPLKIYHILQVMSILFLSFIKIQLTLLAKYLLVATRATSICCANYVPHEGTA